MYTTDSVPSDTEFKEVTFIVLQFGGIPLFTSLNG